MSSLDTAGSLCHPQPLPGENVGPRALFLLDPGLCAGPGAARAPGKSMCALGWPQQGLGRSLSALGWPRQGLGRSVCALGWPRQVQQPRARPAASCTALSHSQQWSKKGKACVE